MKEKRKQASKQARKKQRKEEKQKEREEEKLERKKGRNSSAPTYRVAVTIFKYILWQTIAENKSSKFRQLKERLKERKK
jgi:hypothetical protein